MTQPAGRRARRVAGSRVSAVSPGSRHGRRKAPQPGRTVFKVIASSLLCVGLLTGAGVVVLYNDLNGNIDQKELAGQLGNDRPTKEAVEGPGEPLNVLVMGSDSRSGKGNGVDGESGGGLSDTTILFHLSANRKFAYGISIPRDSAVIRPACYEDDGTEIAGTSGYVKWNEAFAAGGPACTWRQLEQLSGVRVDNYIVVDFNQFTDMVDALNGVKVCLPYAVDDPEHDIHLEAGTQELDGKDSLAYVRVRYGIGGGIDPNRTRRQQAFIGSMINKALTAGMLARPDRLIRFMRAATSSLQTDFDGIAEMSDIARTAQGIGADNIQFVTTPWVFSDKVSAGVEWTPEVEKLWRLVRKDKPLTAEFLENALSAGDDPDGTKSDGGASTSPQSPATTLPGETRASPSEAPDDPTGAPPGLPADARADAGLC